MKTCSHFNLELCEMCLANIQEGFIIDCAIDRYHRHLEHGIKHNGFKHTIMIMISLIREHGKLNHFIYLDAVIKTYFPEYFYQYSKYILLL